VAKTCIDDRKEEIRHRLEKTRTKLFEAIGGLTEEQMRRRPGPGRWSVAEIMAHLPVWERQMLREADSLRQMAGQAVSFPSEAEREEAAGRGHRLPPPGIVHDLVAARWDTLTFLDRLTAQELDRRGRHQAMGELTVARILTVIAEYEEEQVGRILRLQEELDLSPRQVGVPPPGTAGPAM
jgi:uncharacterized damage-inducible protein DinB